VADTWFGELFGFEEEGPGAVRERLEAVEDEAGWAIRSRANGRTVGCGRFSTPSLAELRQKVAELPGSGGPGRFEMRIADVQDLHCDPENAGATFQAASQFNCLEMTGPAVTP